MENIQDKLDEIFRDELGYEYEPQELVIPDIDGAENITGYSREYTVENMNIIVVECIDRRIEFQKEFIKKEKNSVFPNSHFLFISNQGKIIDFYNDANAKVQKKLTYDDISKKKSLFKEKIQLFDVSKTQNGTELQINAERAFETNDKVAKNFFDKFQKIHKKLQNAISGIDDPKDLSWYASVLMNRFMFIYFLQKHNVIQNNPDFLLAKFHEVQQKEKDYYHDFLLPLFFYGFARKDHNPAKQMFVAEYGEVRYLNGGLFYPHQVEKKYTPADVKVDVAKYEEACIQTSIHVDAKKIKEVLEFLNGYTWYLDQRPMKNEDDINPDVLGYIFEKYINQKELGAYYTKEDITEYIAKNTIIPFVLDKMRNNGFSAPDPNPMITNNEDIIAAIYDYIENIDNYTEAKFLYSEVLQPLSVLDPSVGSGAFLFAALNILLPIYQKTVYKLRHFAKTESDEWLTQHLALIDKHKEEYFLTKQIILNNLYGVDIVQEATEICKLRLFLQLVSHISDIKLIEPLPDIDFNIYAGNSLVGGLSWEDLVGNYTMDLFVEGNREQIKSDIEQLAEMKRRFRYLQQQNDHEDELINLKNNIITIDHRINSDLKLRINNPFHWFVDFHSIMSRGGFDVIIGNPPYVEYSKVKKDYEISGYETLKSGNLYSFLMERSDKLANTFNYTSFIVPVSIMCTDRMEVIQKYLLGKYSHLWISSFAERPSKLFEGAERNVSILLYTRSIDCLDKKLYSTHYIKWYSHERDALFDSFTYKDITGLNNKAIIPKLGSNIEVSIWKKLLAEKKVIGLYLSQKNSINKIIYRNSGGRYWKIITDFTPYFTLDGVSQISSRESYLYVSEEKNLYSLIAALSSTTYFWWYIQNSDTRTNNPSHLKNFPVNLDKINIPQLNELGHTLMIDLNQNSKVLTKKQKTGLTEYQQFNPKKSKHIIDEIDKCLAQVYGFTEKELNYIINYDIKYRMGDHDNDEE